MCDVPNMYMSVIKVETSMKNSSRTEERVLEEDPSLGLASCTRQQHLVIGGTSPRHGHGPPRDKMLLRIGDTCRTTPVQVLFSKMIWD